MFPISSEKDELRSISQDESSILKMENYYKNILENYLSTKKNVCDFLKCLKGEEYKNLSQICYYLKDNFNESILEAKDNFKQFSGLSYNLAILNKDYYLSQASLIENRLEVRFVITF